METTFCCKCISLMALLCSADSPVMFALTRHLSWATGCRDLGAELPAGEAWQAPRIQKKRTLDGQVERAAFSSISANGATERWRHLLFLLLSCEHQGRRLAVLFASPPMVADWALAFVEQLRLVHQLAAQPCQLQRRVDRASS